MLLVNSLTLKRKKIIPSLGFMANFNFGKKKIYNNSRRIRGDNFWMKEIHLGEQFAMHKFRLGLQS